MSDYGNMLAGANLGSILAQLRGANPEVSIPSWLSSTRGVPESSPFIEGMDDIGHTFARFQYDSTGKDSRLPNEKFKATPGELMKPSSLSHPTNKPQTSWQNGDYEERLPSSFHIFRTPQPLPRQYDSYIPYGP